MKSVKDINSQEAIISKVSKVGFCASEASFDFIKPTILNLYNKINLENEKLIQIEKKFKIEQDNIYEKLNTLYSVEIKTFSILNQTIANLKKIIENEEKLNIEKAKINEEIIKLKCLKNNFEKLLWHEPDFENSELKQLKSEADNLGLLGKIYKKSNSELNLEITNIFNIARQEIEQIKDQLDKNFKSEKWKKDFALKLIKELESENEKITNFKSKSHLSNEEAKKSSQLVFNSAHLKLKKVMIFEKELVDNKINKEIWPKTLSGFYLAVIENLNKEINNQRELLKNNDTDNWALSQCLKNNNYLKQKAISISQTKEDEELYLRIIELEENINKTKIDFENNSFITLYCVEDLEINDNNKEASVNNTEFIYDHFK